MLDANSAYDVPTAIEAAHAFEPFGIRWLEEPVAWFDPVFGLARVGAQTSIPLASGERELHRFGCRDLVDHTPIRYLQFDCTRAGGITEWLRAAAYASPHGVLMAPHHDPQIHGHLVAAVENGAVLEVFPDPGPGSGLDRPVRRAAGHRERRGAPLRPARAGLELDRDFVQRHPAGIAA